MANLYDWLATPFGWLMGLLYNGTGNYLLALVIITIFTRAILLPSSIKQQKNSAKQMRLQAKVNKIRAKYAGSQTRDAQQKIQAETQELYQREGFNASQVGCFPMLLQLAVMMGLYGAIYAPLSKVLRIPTELLATLKDAFSALPGVDISKLGTRYEISMLDKFADVKAQLTMTPDIEHHITQIETLKEKLTIGSLNLTVIPKDDKGFVFILIPVLAGITALLTSIFMYMKQRKQNPEMAKNPMMGCMTFLSPLMSVYFAWILPSGIGCYWILSNLISFIQTVVLNFTVKPEAIIADQMIDETVQRRSREQAIIKRKKLLSEKKD